MDTLEKSLSTLMIVLGFLVIVGGLMLMMWSVPTGFCAGPPESCQLNYNYNLLIIPSAIGGIFLVAGIGIRYLRWPASGVSPPEED